MSRLQGRLIDELDSDVDTTTSRLKAAQKKIAVSVAEGRASLSVIPLGHSGKRVGKVAEDLLKGTASSGVIPEL